MVLAISFTAASLSAAVHPGTDEPHCMNTQDTHSGWDEANRLAQDSNTAAGANAWFLIHSKPRQELLADQTLRRLGIDTMFPRVKEEKTIRRRKQIVVGPLFPGYLFARFDVASRYRAVSFANGVKRIVAFGPRLAVVDQTTIDSITERMQDGCITIARAPLSPGGSVRITSGPLEGFEAVLERELPAQERVVLLFKRLSYQVRVVVDLDRVANL